MSKEDKGSNLNELLAKDGEDSEPTLKDLFPEIYDKKGNITFPDAPSNIEKKGKEDSTYMPELLGGALGTGYGYLTQGIKPPEYPTKEIERASNALRDSRANLDAIKTQLDAHQNTPAPQLRKLEEAYTENRIAYENAQRLLNAAKEESAGMLRPVKVAPPVSQSAPIVAPSATATPNVQTSLIPTDAQHSRAFEGTMKDVEGGAPITGRASQQTYNETSSYQKLLRDREEETIRKLIASGQVTPEGANDLRIKFGNPASTKAGIVVTPSSASQYAADNNAKLEAENSRRMAEKAIEDKRIADFKAAQEFQERSRKEAESVRQAVERERLTRLANEQGNAKRSLAESKEALGEARRPIDTRTAQLTSGLSKAETSVMAASKIFDELKAANPNFSLAAKFGNFVASHPKVFGGLAGAGVVGQAYDAAERWDKGDRTGGIISGLSSLLGLMSMVPAKGTVLSGIKGVGMAGGAALTAANPIVDYIKSPAAPQVRQ